MFESNDKPMKSLKDVLNKLIEINGWEDKICFSRIVNNWDKIIGDSVANHSLPKKLVEGELHIKTDSSTWRSELLIRQEEIIEKINIFLTKNVVISLKIR